MKRVLFLVADLCSRGAEHQMVTVATLMKKDGIDVSFFCYHTNNFFEQQLKENDIPVTWKKLPNTLKRLLYVRRYIRKGQYDAVISFLQADNMLNSFAALGSKRWKVITGERSSKEAQLTSRRGRIISAFMKKADYIVCNSENAQRMWQKHYPSYSEKLKVIYNHVLLPETNDNYVARKDGKTHIIVAGAYSKVKNPLRVVLDSKARMPFDEPMLRDGAAPVLIATTESAPEENLRRLREAGAEILTAGKGSSVDLSILLRQLGERSICSLLVEGGSTVHFSFLSAGLADKMCAFIAPKLFGGKEAKPAVGGAGFLHLADAARLTDIKTEILDDDFCVSGYLLRE